MKNSIDELIVTEKSLTSQALYSKLKVNGVVVIPDFCYPELLNSLNIEFDKLLEEDLPQAKKLDYSLGKAVIAYRNKLSTTEYPSTYSFFSDKSMFNLTRKYLQQEVDYNSDIFVVKDVVGSKHHANDMHFDVLHTFKFFLYLTDTNVENGAFTCVPGSHKRTADIRKKLGEKISFENRELSRDLPYQQDEVVPIVGKAGTLIIFDTDVFHKAGTVSKGERRVMRGHNRISKDANKTNYKGLFSKIKSFLNKK